MEVTAKKSLYLRGLQSAYSGVLEVIDDVFHVAVYRFYSTKSSWERMDIEGSAYVTRNSSNPLYSLIVLNKKGDADLILHVEENIEKLHIQDQYIMLRCNKDGNQVIFGVWVHDSSDRERFYHSIVRTKEMRKNSPDMSSLLGKFVAGRKCSANPIASALATGEPASNVVVIDESHSILSMSTNSSKSGNKTSTLLSLLKSGPRKPPTDVNTNPNHSSNLCSSNFDTGKATLDDIMRKPEVVKSINSSNDASTKLLSLLAGKKTSSSDDFPTDVQISAKAKQRNTEASDPRLLLVDAPKVEPGQKMHQPIPIEKGVASLKAVLSIGGSGNNSVAPSRGNSGTESINTSPKQTSSKSSSESTSPVTVPSYSAAFGTISPVTVAVSSLQEPSLLASPSRLFVEKEKPTSLLSFALSTEYSSISSIPAPSTYGTIFRGMESVSAKKVVKLISPSDLGEVY